jgi:hypothetical protein
MLSIIILSAVMLSVKIKTLNDEGINMLNVINIERLSAEWQCRCAKCHCTNCCGAIDLPRER